MSDTAAAAPRWLSLGSCQPDGRAWIPTRSAGGPMRAGSRRTSRPAGIGASTARRSRRWSPTRRAGSRPLASLGASPERLARAYRRKLHGRHADRARRPGRRRRTNASAIDATAGCSWRRWSRTSMPMPATRPSGSAPRRRRRPSSTTSRAGWRSSGTSLTEAVGLFVAARRPFLDELTGLGRRRALDASRLAALYEDASGLLDRLLLRLIATYQEAAR